MTRAEFAMGSAVFLAVALAGTASVKRLDRYVAAKSAAPPAVSSPACIGEDGSWKNWVWANVPALSPKCAGKNP
ncbi:hypothetical protein [Bradyrhizobium sp.]|jgi:hypothetical protein|uniref:hypothetical protein n=1 Tax=Bradyrhizobium sp. TaxID=376 RepID=UPI003C5BD225